MPEAGIDAGVGEGAVARGRVYNNLLDRARCVVRLAPGSNFQSDYNGFTPDVTINGLTLESWRQDPRGSQLEANSFAGDLQFVTNPRESPLGFHTRPGSPARDRAVHTGDPYCFSGLDIGARETCLAW
jgi:hypothetical protein